MSVARKANVNHAIALVYEYKLVMVFLVAALDRLHLAHFNFRLVFEVYILRETCLWVCFSNWMVFFDSYFGFIAKLSEVRVDHLLGKVA